MKSNIVLGIDSWTKGVHNFARLQPALKTKGLDLQLLHLGSWGNDPYRAEEEIINGMAVRDISFFGKMNFLEIIDSEKPVAVIFLSIDTFAHRAFNRYCKYRGIPVLHLYHGLVSVQDVNNKPHKMNVLSQSKFVLSRLAKAIIKVWPTYIKSLIITRAGMDEWVRFATDIYNLVSGKYMPIASIDAQTDRCAVYTNADLQHAVKKYGLSREYVVAVGNPDLTLFGLKKENIGCRISKENYFGTEVIYIDTGLIYAGAVFNNADDFLDHLLDTKRGIESQGKTLSVKLHPCHYTTPFPIRLSENGIELIQNEDFVRRLQNCEAVIVEPSTAALIPALMGIPILLARFGKLHLQAYGEVLTSYPRAKVLINILDINQLLHDESKNYNSVRVTEWISQNSGPLPAEQMPERVAEIIENMINQKKAKQ